MSERCDMQGEQAVDEKRAAIRRRGLIAGAAALVTGLVAARTASPVSAGVDGDIVASTTTVTSATTTILANPALATSPAFRANNLFTGALDPHGDGIQGFTTNPQTVPPSGNAGVFGRVDDLNGVGIFGEATNGTGAFGDSGSGSGVAGSSGSGSGVFGISSTSNGVYGVSTNGLYGVRGDSGNQPGAAGLLGVATNAAAIAFGSVVVGGATIAGQFNGDVNITGALNVGGAKRAITKDKAGDYRSMYCVEAPESWFEDFGTGTITNGSADITIDPEFAQFVDLKDYHVFLTEKGGTHHHLSVQSKTPKGFTVGADQEVAKLKGKKASDLNGQFDWRLVAKRADIKGERLAKVHVPELKVDITGQRPNLPKSRR